ncbi:MAG: RluA family pseudouridine synthase [Planctomycetaceae bacterium]|jgi:RluA family pseudouridine synthase|nr:RluA family pseudouridine synthase [Planctomycetaceae bacterium]
MPDFEILLEDGPLFAVNKPAGLLTQAPPGIDSLEHRVKDFLTVRDNKPGRCYLGVPHRLDRPVSGAILFAKHTRAARRLSEQFESRTVKKTYWTAVENSPEEETGTWQDYVKKIPNQPSAVIVSSDDEEAREAILHYGVLQRFPYDFGGRKRIGALLEIQLETGRMHQIRIQAASRGFPVLGDFHYGSTIPFGEQFEDTRLRGIALHARSITFQHPMTHVSITLNAPLPQVWQTLNLRPFH